MQQKNFQRIKRLGALIGAAVWMAGAFHSIWSGQIRWFLSGFLFAWFLNYVLIRGWLERRLAHEEALPQNER